MFLLYKYVSGFNKVVLLNIKKRPGRDFPARLLQAMHLNSGRGLSVSAFGKVHSKGFTTGPHDNHYTTGALDWYSIFS